MGPLTRSNKLRLQSQRTNARVERGFAPSDSEAAFPSSTPTGRTHSIRSPAPELLALGFQKGRSLAVPVASPPETSPGQGSQRQTLSGVWREGAWGPLCLIPPGGPGRWGAVSRLFLSAPFQVWSPALGSVHPFLRLVCEWWGEGVTKSNEEGHEFGRGTCPEPLKAAHLSSEIHKRQLGTMR